VLGSLETRLKIFRWVVIAVLLGGVGYLSLGTIAANQTAPIASGVLRVYFIDVGQGDSIFIQSADGSTALIDGGYDNGMALAYLQSIGSATHLNAVIASHPHADHIGGLSEVMETFAVDGVWTSGAIHTTYAFEHFIDTIDARHIPYHEVTIGDHISAGSLQFDVLYGQTSNSNLNNTSLVLRLVYGNVSFLFTGDAESSVETQLVETNADRLPATILKVGHHGSYTSSSPAFLAAVHPQVAVYSAGGNNSYGHPHQVTLAHLAAVGAIVYGTNVSGTIVVETDGTTYTVRTSVGEPLSTPVTVREGTPLATLLPQVQVVAPFDPNGGDRDCGSFATHEDAQAFFVLAGGPQNDLHRLDGDDDGVACENLPHRRANAQSNTAVMGYDPSGGDRDCGNFQTHEEAQAFFVTAGGPERDPHRLDGDDDGIACESLP
jgi:competence protein ComEC